MSMLDAALHYAARGWRVFPCRPGTKIPATFHGCRDASCDEHQIRAWWGAAPDCNVAVATGQGITVADLDVKNGVNGIDEFPRLEPHPALTPMVRTVNGGLHRYYWSPGQEIRCRVAVVPGVDVRGDGGYVIAPPSLVDGRRYAWVTDASPDDLELAPLPDWLLPQSKQSPAATAYEPRQATGGTTPYGRAALDRELSTLATATEGQRNHALNRAAFCVYQLVAGGEIDPLDAAQLRDAALALGLTPHETDRTIRSGRESGEAEPRSAPPTSVASWTTPIHAAPVEPIPDYALHPETPDAPPAPAEAPKPQIEMLPIILAGDVVAHPITYLVRDMIPMGSCGFVSGLPASRKSWWTAEIAVGVASGTPVCGLATARGPVVIFNAEDDPAAITRPRLEALAAARNIDLGDLPIYLIDLPALSIEDPVTVARLAVTLETIGAVLLVLDPLRNLHHQDEDKSTCMAPLLAGLRGVQQQTHCTIMLVHHDSKKEDGRRESRTRGSNALEGWRDWAMWCDATGNSTTVKRYVKASPPLGEITFSLEDGPDGRPVLTAGGGADGLRADVLALLAAHPEGLSRSQIRETLGKDRIGLPHVVDALIREQAIEEIGIERPRKNGKSFTSKALVLA